ncbi:hypothetical protein [Roseimicrobium sp. ORNL1]|uniref:hypothetical protein n=1 Tax=Roseimicrobium sp. ORNL1 TaxID=2711231 RepID=UPI0013E1920A|nr:hypothetical protein [Roseimicrobium sp. ORNL1]QIF03155.1 hypothetical protein G5S37_17035 [Roseimicrobium sp. ORNL1]
MAPLPSAYTPEQVASAQLLADSLSGLALMLVWGVGVLMPIVVVIRSGSLWKACIIAVAGMVSAGVIIDFVIEALVEQVWPSMLARLTGKHGYFSVLTTEVPVGFCWLLLLLLFIALIRKLSLSVQNRLRRKPSH